MFSSQSGTGNTNKGNAAQSIESAGVAFYQSKLNKIALLQLNRLVD